MNTRASQIPRLKRPFSDNERRIFYRQVSFQERAREVDNYRHTLQMIPMSHDRMLQIWNDFRKARTALRRIRTPEFFTYMDSYYDQPHQQGVMCCEKAFRMIDDILKRRYSFDPRDPNYHPRRG